MEKIRAQFQNGNKAGGHLGVVGERWGESHSVC